MFIYIFDSTLTLFGCQIQIVHIEKSGWHYQMITNKQYLFFLLLLFHVNLFGQSLIVLENTEQLKPIAKSALFYQDNEDLSPELILSPAYQKKFEPYHQNIPNFATTADAVWFRFDLKKEVEEDFYLRLGSAYIDSIFLYEQINGRLHLVRQAGDNYIFPEREIEVPNFLFKLEVSSSAKKTYYLRTKCLQPFFFPLQVGTLKAFLEDQHTLDFVQGIYFGFMLLIFLYNLFLYFSTKESIYWYYVFYVASITLFMGFIFHYGFQYLWPNWPGINRYAVVSSALTMISAVLFSQKFLMTKTNTPSLHWISNLFLGVASLVIFLLILQINIPALLMAQAGILLMAIYFLVIGIVALRKGYTPAKFYLVAWGALILGFIAAIFESLNLIPVTPYINSMQIGSAVEVTLLSFALADRINKYKKEREEAQASALQAAKEKNTLIAQQNIMLEKKVEERTTKIKETLKLVEIEKLKSEELLLNILPQSTANELKENGTAKPKHFESVTVMFFDIEKFTTLAEQLPSEELVARLDELFQHIDEIVERSSLEKIKTIGDAYMAAGGIPLTNDSHPIDAIKAAVEVMTYLSKKEPDSQGNKWRMRCGIHTGPVVAGVVGKNKFAYDIWGSTVNFASRMESSGEVGKINISEATYQLVKSQMPCTLRGAKEVKGLGKLNMYFVKYN